jgi:hypothetical protein
MILAPPGCTISISMRSRPRHSKKLTWCFRNCVTSQTSPSIITHASCCSNNSASEHSLIERHIPRTHHSPPDHAFPPPSSECVLLDHAFQTFGVLACWTLLRFPWILLHLVVRHQDPLLALHRPFSGCPGARSHVPTGSITGNRGTDISFPSPLPSLPS